MAGGGRKGQGAIVPGDDTSCCPIAGYPPVAGGPEERPVADRLLGLANELHALSAQLRSEEPVGLPAAPPAAFPAPHADDTGGAHGTFTRLARARDIYRQRRRRQEFFNGDLFSEPAWDMLLDLYIAGCEGKQVSTTSACIGASVPVATGLRWLQLLESEGLIERRTDPTDGRRTFVSLTTLAYRSMNRYFDADMTGAVVPLRPVSGRRR